jgi:predicted O-linked N-acetylglucosamine transferase (SPINDLY family)
MEPLLRLIDRGQFEIILYNFGTKPDAMTAHLRNLASLWRDFPSNLENVVEPLVRADAPDIAVDLGGHTGHSLMPLFARRLAPVQISYLGYPNTTGLSAMDYRFVDETTDPTPEADAFATEKLVRFSSCAWAYTAPTGAPEPSAPPCCTNGYVTFGSFNNFSKITDEILTLWSQLLADVPHSRLFLKSVGLAESSIVTQVQERMRRLGVPVDRVDLSGARATTAEHLAAYSLVDIALDTFPYNGTTTTCEAFFMGVPVIAVAGNRHASRVGASLLRAIGRPEWIAPTPDLYRKTAIDLANVPAQLKTIRQELRTVMSQSLLMNHAEQATRFGAALRNCWLRE